ncbi:MAG: hypothetical protein COT33_01165 [Candidatus Nealsonbacteria bacterium CG08_land_8_20_14_0_20_38_20]|uniref:Type II toxin-antitoxin system mRNA interferase toxin, RelE/StbE family n=1 Tax=Candidatus Nealsonbacteria bacterium CG08_land_8_20_14_0_20_38_20 TaxID=1974705 RepID=A0A2H0YM61_9BACT|nr:MAG: hypothetical protein COT33_01165 [Candidatus Nealsonbacteria bacterium CG08_land_8_20_14_0_20_38_20]
MKVIHSERFKKNFRNFPLKIQKKFEKQIDYLLRDIRYPSLHAKKYDESRGIWQARVNGKIRFYFLIEDDTYILLDIRKHQK